jgi:hypothetical protein
MGDLEGDAEGKTGFFTHHWTNIGMTVSQHLLGDVRIPLEV